MVLSTSVTLMPRFSRRACTSLLTLRPRKRDLDAALLQARLHLALDLAPEVDLCDADVPLRVAVNVLKLGHLLCVEEFDQRFCQKHDAVRASHRAPLDDGALDHVANVCERDAVAAELF